MCGRAVGLHDLCLKVSLNQDESCPACVCSFPFFCKQGLACSRSWKHGIRMLLLFLSLFLFFCVEGERACDVSPLPVLTCAFCFSAVQCLNYSS